MKIIKKDWVYIPELNRSIKLLTDENNNLIYLNKTDIDDLKNKGLRSLYDNEINDIRRYIDISSHLGYIIFNEKKYPLSYKYGKEINSSNDLYVKGIGDRYYFSVKGNRCFSKHSINDESYKFMCFATNID